MLYDHQPHEHIEARKSEGPVKLRDEATRFNAKLGLAITVAVGTMWCAYIFAIIALISLPSAIASHNVTVLIAWLSSNFLQLILLPIIIVGQNLQASTADKRSEQTYRDAEAVLAEALKIQEHLAAQDSLLERLAGHGENPDNPADRPGAEEAPGGSS